MKPFGKNNFICSVTNTKNIFKKFTFIVCLLSLSACNNGGGGSNGPAANTANPDAIKKISASLAALNGVQENSNKPMAFSKKGKDAKISLNSIAMNALENTIANNEGFEQSNPTQQKQRTEQLKQRLSSAINPDDCEMILPENERNPPTNSNPSNPSEPNFEAPKLKNMVFSVKGPKCPLEMKLEIYDASADGTSANLKADFKVQDEDLKKELDIISGNWNGNIKVSISENKEQKKIEIKMGMKLTISGESVSYGHFTNDQEMASEIKIDLGQLENRQKKIQTSAPGNEFNSDFGLNQMFNGFIFEHKTYAVGGGITDMSAKLVLMPSENNQSVFYINGKSVSAQEYMEASSQFDDQMKKIGNPGGGGKPVQIPSEDPVSYSALCNIYIFDEKTIDEKNALIALKSGVDLADKALHFKSSCSKNINHASVSVMGQNYNYSLEFSSDLIFASIINSKSNMSYNFNIQPAMLASRNISYARGTTEGTVLAMSCQKVAMCP